MSTKPLQQYFDTLFTFAEASFEKVDKTHGLDLAKIAALQDAGFLLGTNTSTVDELSFIDVSISPAGAAVLAEWKSLLERGTFRHRAATFLDKLFWLAVGASATLIAKLFV